MDDFFNHFTTISLAIFIKREEMLEVGINITF